MAGVGPLVSLLLGAGYGLLAAGLGTAGLTGPLVGACVWLAGVNVLLAVFNAIPAAPLDGGRMLRAALWHWRGDPLWATVTAARAGRMLGIFLVVLGLYGFLRTGGISLLWLGFIGWFLAGAATAEEQQALLEDRLTSVRVGDVMSRTPTPRRRTSPCRAHRRVPVPATSLHVPAAGRRTPRRSGHAPPTESRSRRPAGADHRS